jgi:hypothetical protein
LKGNSRLPDRELKAFYDTADWKRIVNMPYTAYVIFNGTVNRDNVIKISKIKESYPDDSRDEQARLYATQTQSDDLHTGSRTRPRVRVYVVFYENEGGSNRALVFTKKTGDIAHTDSANRSIFMRYVEY